MAKTGAVIRPRRGEIYVVNFEPTVGAEIRKSRPGVVIQNDIANRWSPITIVAAITSKAHEGRTYPTEVLVQAPEGGLRTDSVILLNQIRSIDTSRLVRRLGVLRTETLRAVDRALLLSLGLVEL
jgi:mRNA interferase MazF